MASEAAKAEAEAELPSKQEENKKAVTWEIVAYPLLQ
jgi:hypothetical protein